MRFEFRWQGPNIADGTNHAIFSVGSFQLSVTNGNQFWVSEFYDSVENNGCMLPNWSGNAHTDIVGRVTRTIKGSGGTVRLEIYDTGIGVASLVSCSASILGVAARPVSNFADLGIAIGGAGATGSLGFLRWFDSTVPPGAIIPVAPPANAGYLLDYEFQNSIADMSGHRVNLHASSPAYADVPLYPPVCNAGEARAFRVGSPAQLDARMSTSLIGDSLSYTWRAISAPETINWTSPSSVAQPTFVPNTPGTYTFQLTVVDSSNQPTSCIVKDGAVVTDENDIVVISDPNANLLLSPSLRLGASPWPWYDNQHAALADFFGSLQTTDFADVWNNALTGTISVTKGSAAVSGSGTSFIHDVCGNGSGTYLIVWYPIGDGTFGRYPAGISSCDSDTQITLSAPYQMSESASGLSFSIMTNSQVFTWINPSTFANYYDNVMAFYSLYYRTGIDTYLQYARTLADRWWTLPWIDKGQTCNLSGLTPCLTARARSFTGLVLRALDGRPDMWPGLRKWWDADRYMITHSSIYDTREQAYQTANVALCAMFDPDSDHQQLCANDLSTALGTLWTANEKSGGYWLNPSYGYATWNGAPGTVSVTNGSTMVQGVGTNWSAAMFPEGNAFWITKAPLDSVNGDPVSYSATYVDSTHVRLDRPYEGPTSSNRGWQSNNLVGYGTQPFMMGIAVSAFYYAYLATGDDRARQMAIDSAYWIAQNGYRPSTRGLYYGRYFVNCTPIRENLPNCSSDPAEDSRFLAGEVMNAVSRGYMLTGDKGLLAVGDSLFGAMFGKPGFGGPQSDSIYLTEIDAGGVAFLRKKAKDFGYFFGFGQSWTWPAARLATGASLPPVRRPNRPKNPQKQ